MAKRLGMESIFVHAVDQEDHEKRLHNPFTPPRSYRRPSESGGATPCSPATSSLDITVRRLFLGRFMRNLQRALRSPAGGRRSLIHAATPRPPATIHAAYPPARPRHRPGEQPQFAAVNQMVSSMNALGRTTKFEYDVSAGVLPVRLYRHVQLLIQYC
jgi:hypothetical protein